MVRRIIAGTAVAGALMLATAGVAGAADTAPTTASTTAPTTAPSSTPASSTTTTTTPCSNLAEMLKQYHSTQTKDAKRMRRADAKEARLRRLGHAKLASLYAKRVNRARVAKKHLEARLHQAVADCGGNSKGTGLVKGSGSGKGTGSSKAPSSTSSTS